MRSTTFDLTFVTLLGVLGVTFAVDGWFGTDGGAHLDDLRTEIAREEARIAALESERDRLDAMTRGLRGPEIDMDLLDERLRAAFGVGREDEALILAPPPSSR